MDMAVIVSIFRGEGRPPLCRAIFRIRCCDLRGRTPLDGRRQVAVSWGVAPVTALAPVIELGDDRIFVRALDERERAAAAADLSLQRTMTGLLGVLTLAVAACAPWWPSPIMAVILLGLLLGAIQGVRRAMQRRRELRDNLLVSVCSERRSLHVFAGSGRRVDANIAGPTDE